MKRYYSAFVLGHDFDRTYTRPFSYERGSVLSEALLPMPNTPGVSGTMATLAHTNLNQSQRLVDIIPDRLRFVTASPMVDEVVEFLSAAYVDLSLDPQRASTHAPLAHLLGDGIQIDIPVKIIKAMIDAAGTPQWYIRCEVRFEDDAVNGRLRSYLAAPYGSLLATLSALAVGIPADALLEEMRAKDAERRLGGPAGTGLPPTRFWGWLVIEGRNHV